MCVYVCLCASNTVYVRVRVYECARTRVHVPSVCTFVGVSVVFVFMVKAVNDES